ncbi:MAG: cobalamin biosynthesis protein CobD [Clostridiales bacterium]|nr:cobalamin biosynthesis protein CobD [Clostridiales bacterium]
MRANVAAMLLGLFIDMLIGDPEWFPHPVRFIGRYISFMEGRLRRRFPDKLHAAAVLLTLSTVAGTMLVTAAALGLAGLLGRWPLFIAKALLSWMCISCRCMAKEAEQVRAQLARGLERGRRQVSRIVGRDTACLSEEEIVKATVETVAENTTDGVISPMLWLALLGPIGGMGFKAASTLDSMVGYLDDRHRDIGWSSARLDDALNYIPARLTGALMSCAAAIVRLDGRNAWRIVKRDHANHLSPNCAWSEAAAAGAMHIQLGGTHEYFGKPVEKPTIGDPDRRAEGEDIHRACRLLYGTTALMALLGMLALLPK